MKVFFLEYDEEVEDFAYILVEMMCDMWVRSQSGFFSLYSISVTKEVDQFALVFINTT